MFDRDGAAVWDLEFGIWDLFGLWDLGFGI
jgi:hypothetical protein